MNSEDEEKESEEKEEKKIYKTKDQILDESFKKAELSKIGKNDTIDQHLIIKKPLQKIGFLIVIIAIIGIAILNYMPVLYINYETENSSITQFISYEDFKLDKIEPEEINSIFESTCYDCSDNSDSYIGLTINDFIDAPKFTSYVFYIMIIIGVLFSIIGLVDRKKNFSEKTNTIIHSIFTAFIILTGIIMLILNMKFLDANLLQHLNKPFLKELGFNRIQLLFFEPYFIIFISVILFVIGLIHMKLDLNKAFEKYTLINSKDDNIRFNSRSKI